jgi:ribosome maturation factor RimP
VAISRYVGFHLEEENTIAQAYNLEVSSPGVGEPLKLNRQYQKNIGRTVGLKLKDGKKREGKLLQVAEDSLTIEESVKEKGKKAVSVESIVPLNDIIETSVLISFK